MGSPSMVGGSFSDIFNLTTILKRSLFFPFKIILVPLLKAAVLISALYDQTGIAVRVQITCHLVKFATLRVSQKKCNRF